MCAHARASPHDRGALPRRPPPLKYVQIAKKASTRLKAKKKTKGDITPTMVHESA